MEIKNKKPLFKTPGREGMLLAVIFFIPVMLGWFIFVKQAQTADDYLLERASQLITPGLTSFMRTISFLGSYQFLVPANLALMTLFLIRKENKNALQTLLLALSSLGWMSLLKNLFQRIRPDDPLVHGIKNYSFPSGHAMMSVAFFGWLIWLTKRRVKDPRYRNLIILLLVLIILAIGFSRVYLRVHYPSDILAGYCIGIFWISCCLWIFRKTGLR